MKDSTKVTTKTLMISHQAFFLTAAVVVGLTAFTFQVQLDKSDLKLKKSKYKYNTSIILVQTKRDFSNIGAALYTGLLVLILGGFMNIFIGR